MTVNWLCNLAAFGKPLDLNADEAKLIEDAQTLIRISKERGWMTIANWTNDIKGCRREALERTFPDIFVPYQYNDKELRRALPDRKRIDDETLPLLREQAGLSPKVEQQLDVLRPFFNGFYVWCNPAGQAQLIGYYGYSRFYRRMLLATWDFAPVSQVSAKASNDNTPMSAVRRWWRNLWNRSSRVPVAA